MRRIGFLWHDAFLVHDAGPDHPERADRLRAIKRGLEQGGFLGTLVPIHAREARDDELYFVHRPEYVAHVERQCKLGKRYLDSLDTGICPESYRVALLAAGGAMACVDAVAAGRVDAAFAAIRPPGHHAEADRAMGFCIFNNAALAARHAQAAHGIERVLVCDFDVHHGNGTQNAFYHDGSVFYFSIHQSPFYPGTGEAEETGEGDGRGATLNVPLPAGSGDQEFVSAVGTLARRMEDFRPGLVLVSAGFDAHEGDPLAHMSVTAEGYRRMTALLREIAGRHARGRLVSLLEGGYDLDNLSRSVRAHLEELGAAER